MSVFNRPMFRVPGMNNQASGIMASSPNLIRVSTAQANPLVGNIPPNRGSSINIPPISTVNTTGFRNPEDQKGPETKSLIQASQQRPIGELSNLEKLRKAALREKGKKTVDDLDPKIGEKSQTMTSNIDDADADYFGGDVPLSEAPLTNEGSGKADLKPNPNAGTTSEPNILSGFQSKQKQLSDRMQTAVANLSTGLASADDIKLGGKTIVENTNALVAKMQEKGQEPTLADVQDDAIKLLGFDPRELEGEFEEDRKASIFLNMMKAGLAMAAGESPNAITNIARGFGVGLQGYGEDVKNLTKDLREDRREARATMYNLLKDAKSEALAKRTLELQQMEGIVNINRQLVGDKRQAALNAFNMKMTELKWNQNLLSAAADLQFKEKSLQVTKENAEKTYMLGLQKAQPEVIQLLIADGEITLQDPSKGPVAGNLVMSPKATENVQKYIKELVAGTSKGLNSGSEYNVTRREIQTTGLIPNSFLKSPSGFKDLSDDIKKSFGIQGQALAELLEKNAGDENAQFRDTINFIRKFKQQIPGLAMDFNSLPSSIQTYLQSKRGKKELEKLNQEGILGL